MDAAFVFLDLSIDVVLPNDKINGETVLLCKEKFDHSLIIGLILWSDALI